MKQKQDIPSVNRHDLVVINNNNNNNNNHHTNNNHIHHRPMNGTSRRSGWDLKSTPFADNSINPIRQIVENMKVQPNPNKKFIPLSIGDPTLFGNLCPPESVTDALISAVKSNKFNGYLPSNGLEDARISVAKYVSVDGAQIGPNDVFLTSGASHALDLCIGAMAPPGTNILIPRPGFGLYKTLCCGYGVNYKLYNLLPEKGWEIDLDHLESLIDGKTVAIVYNNPSNPCGSVFSRSHMEGLLQVAERNFVPIIADEIYENMVFPGETFLPIASLTTEVPVLSCRGTTKRFMIPGMRLGWITVHDRHGRLGQIRRGLNQLCQRIMGPNAIVQGALKSIIEDCPESFFEGAIDIIKENAMNAFEILSKVPGLNPIKPAGAMYIMVGIDMGCFPEFATDLEMVERMVSEESVFCLPGQCFDYPNYIRLVLTCPQDMTVEACNRITSFCTTYYVNPPSLSKMKTKKVLEGEAKELIMINLPPAVETA